jgi:hypothetical protein
MTVEKNRKRPKMTSTNARVVRAVFGDSPVKKLFIPLAIDAYNHHMNGVDITNQRRKYASTQRKRNIRSWRPLFHFLLNISITNCYLLWRIQARRKAPHVRWNPKEFSKALASTLFVFQDEKPTEPPLHISPEKIAGDLPIGIPKDIAEVTNMQSINFARQHHRGKLPDSKKRNCVFYRA